MKMEKTCGETDRGENRKLSIGRKLEMSVQHPSRDNYISYNPGTHREGWAEAAI